MRIPSLLSIALCLALSVATAFAESRVYRGGYASGTPAWTVKDNHVYVGGYTSGTPFLTWGDLDEIPQPILVFLAILASGEA